MNHHSASTHSVDETPITKRLRNARRVSSVAGLLLASMLFLCMSLTARACWSNPAPDFTKHDVPLYKQITDRIRNKILARLGDGRNSQERYFMIPFAYENRGNDPGYSHSFMTVIRVLPDHKQVKLTGGVKKRTYMDREFEAFTISWLPHDFVTNPNLCVFKGFGARLVPKMNQCPVSPGKSFTLKESIQLGANVGNAVCMWGPYEISRGGFDLAVKRLRLLEGGTIKYRADDRLTRGDLTAINCFRAMAGLYEFFPNGGIFGTGFNMWGINGTARVLIEYNETANFRKLLLEPVDEKKDRFGFVYAESPESRFYNPFQVSSAYRK